MAVPSAIHHHHSPLQTLKFDEGSSKVQLISAQLVKPNRCRFNRSLYPIRIFYSGTVFDSQPSILVASADDVAARRCGLHRGFAVFCSKRDNEDDVGLSTTSALEGISNLSSNDIDSKNSLDSSSASYSENYLVSVKTVALWVASAVIFGIGLGLKEGVDKASEFFAGYILEQSLSVDNLFVFVLIFKYFKVPAAYESRVLSYGIAGAVIFRLLLIVLGAATLQKFEGVNLLLAAVLLYSAFKLFGGDDEDSDLANNFVVKTCQKFIPVTAEYEGNHFFTVQDGIWKVDSIPAVFGVTRDPFIVFTSNLYAILGLRSLYTVVSQGMSELEYLQPSIAVVLGFIGCKMILDFFSYHVSTEVSLGFVATSLTAGVLLSLIKKSQ